MENNIFLYHIGCCFRSFKILDDLLAQQAHDLATQQLEFDSFDGKVYCLSDIHVDCRANNIWLREQVELNSYLSDCIIVAGDVSSGVDRLSSTLLFLKSKFK